MTALTVPDHDWPATECRLSPALAREALGQLPRTSHSLRRGEALAPHAAAAEEAVFAVTGGAVKLVSLAAGSTRETILAILGPGELFGHLPHVVADWPPFSVVAMEDATICEFPAGIIGHAMEESPALALMIVQVLGRRLCRLQARLSHLLYKDSRQRVACALLELLEDWSSPHMAGLLLNLRVTHQDIAALAGLTRETVSMALAEFELEEIIQTFGRKIVVRNIASLRAVCDGRLKIKLPE